MLSFGIRNGRGFDKKTITKMLEGPPREFDYDFVVIGTNPGGVTCAREATAAGKKTAIIRLKRYSPAEEEGFNEDLNRMAEVLGESEYESRDFQTIFPKSQFSVLKKDHSKTKSSSMTSSRRVRMSRLDLNNELFQRSQQCIKLMQNTILLGDVVEDAHNCGWRLTSMRPPFTINWRKMSEEIMDYTLKENWELAMALEEENIEIMTAMEVAIKDKVITVKESEHKEHTFTTGLMCLALSSECIFPEDVLGAKECGITCDDFIRMSDSPNKTLIVGLTPESLECAGIVIGCRFPVTVVFRKKCIRDCDGEIIEKIMEDLKSRGVNFKEDTSLVSLDKTLENKIIATFEPVNKTSNVESEEENEKKDENKSEEENQIVFDTVLFAVGREIRLDKLNGLKVEMDWTRHKIRADGKGQTTVPYIYAVGDIVADRPEGYEICLLDGKLLGKRLFHNGTELLDYSMIPHVMYTPLEYAWVGLCEDSALNRLGSGCVDIYFGSFKPLDFVLPPKKKECFAKVAVFKSGNLVVGLHVLGPDAGEIVQGFAAAIRTGLTIQSFQTVVGVVASKAREILKLKQTRTVGGMV